MSKRYPPTTRQIEAMERICGHKRPLRSLREIQRPAIVSISTLAAALGKTRADTERWMREHNVRIHRAGSTVYAIADDVRRAVPDCDDGGDGK